MKYEDLRNIRHSQIEAKKLIPIAPDTFEKAHAELTTLTKKVYELNDPFSEEAITLINETNAIKETLQEVYLDRLSKILSLAAMHAEGVYYDRDEVKRMVPAEKEMFDQITESIGQCQAVLLYNAPRPLIAASPASSIDDEESEAALYNEEATIPLPSALPKPANPLAHPCVLVHVLGDMDSFMGVDGRIYTLAKGDIVTLPERNAAVLSERNIVLNINLCK